MGQAYYATTYTSALGVRRAALPNWSPAPGAAPHAGAREPRGLVLDAHLTAWLEQPGISPNERAQRNEAARRIQAAIVMRPQVQDAFVASYGDINLTNFNALTSLPPKLHGVRNLVLKGCTHLRCLPDRLHIEGNLVLDHCISFERISPGVRLDGHLSMRDCALICEVPETLQLKRGLDARRCISLERVATTGPVQGNVDLSGCTALAELQEDFRVDGNLTMQGCTGLRHIARGLRVTGNFDVTGCDALHTVGDDALIDGDINYTDCASLRELPSHLMRSEGAQEAMLRTHPVPPRPRTHRRRGVVITLSGTAIHREAINGLLAALHPTRQLVFRATAQAWTAPMHSLGEILAQYGAEGVPHATTLVEAHTQWGLAAHEAAGMRSFLAALRTTTDYQSAVTRPVLLGRLNEVLATLHEQPAARSEALTLMDDALTACEDRIILGLDRIEVQQAVRRAQKAQDPESFLYQLGLSLLQLEVVDRHAAQTCVQLGDGVDAVEVYLRYRTALRPRLGLPGAAVTMKYGCEVSPQDLENAARAARAVLHDPTQVDAFFDAWDPWQAHLRGKQIAACPYSGLPVRSPGDTSLLCCPITLKRWADVQQPVFCAAGDGLEMYEFDALLPWWREHGTAPARGVPLPWGALFVAP